MDDFEVALKNSLFLEYKNSMGEPDAENEDKLNRIADSVINKDPFEVLKKESLDFSKPPSLALIGFDIDRIKDYVFASNSPKEIKGASAIIEEFTDTELKDSIKDFVDERHIIFAGGGSGIILAPRCQAEKIKDGIEKRFQELTISGTCTVEYEEFFPYELVYGKGNGKIKFQNIESKIKNYFDLEHIKFLSDKKSIPFGKFAEILGSKIRKAKYSKIREEFYPIPGVLRRCASCGIRPASFIDIKQPDYNSDQPWKTAICESCARKRKVGEEKKAEEFSAQSFNDLVKDYNKKYISIIYLDVNKMGKVRENLETSEEYRSFSKIIKDTLNGIVFELKGMLNHKFQSLVMGGDDLILILPAEEAVRTVVKINSFIEDRLKEVEKNENISNNLKEKLQNLTLAIGFIIAPVHFPIKFLVNYAFEILQDAKRLSYKNNQSSVSFLTLKDSSPINVSIEEHFKANYKTMDVDLFSRPYSLNDFRENIKTISKIKTIPKAQLNILRNLLLNESPKLAIFNIRYQTAKTAELWKNILGNDITEWSKFFIQRVNGRYRTKFIDILELMEFGGKNED